MPDRLLLDLSPFESFVYLNAWLLFSTIAIRNGKTESPFQLVTTFQGSFNLREHEFFFLMRQNLIFAIVARNI